MANGSNNNNNATTTINDENSSNNNNDDDPHAETNALKLHLNHLSCSLASSLWGQVCRTAFVIFVRHIRHWRAERAIVTMRVRMPEVAGVRGMAGPCTRRVVEASPVSSTEH
mmetsp:Transcript_2247/g.4114  ORF Transcript_2247/g.4114 Transcript_2247/m.4114 type:complete len:112 (-) Transcript_2247:240-575(-)